MSTQNPAWSFHREALEKIKAEGREASQQGSREGALPKDRQSVQSECWTWCALVTLALRNWRHEDLNCRPDWAT